VNATNPTIYFRLNGGSDPSSGSEYQTSSFFRFCVVLS
jgi:hypothetical protein